MWLQCVHVCHTASTATSGPWLAVKAGACDMTGPYWQWSISGFEQRLQEPNQITTSRTASGLGSCVINMNNTPPIDTSPLLCRLSEGRAGARAFASCWAGRGCTTPEPSWPISCSWPRLNATQATVSCSRSWGLSLWPGAHLPRRGDVSSPQTGLCHARAALLGVTRSGGDTAGLGKLVCVSGAARATKVHKLLAGHYADRCGRLPPGQLALGRGGRSFCRLVAMCLMTGNPE